MHFDQSTAGFEIIWGLEEVLIVISVMYSLKSPTENGEVTAPQLWTQLTAMDAH